MSDVQAASPVAAIKSQIDTLEARRRPWEPLWKDSMEFAQPTRLFDPRTAALADKRPKSNFNNRAALAVTKSSAGFQGYTANRRSQWARLQFENISLNKEHGVSDWLELCERRIYAVLSRRGYYESLGEFVPDGMVAGTATQYIEEVASGVPGYMTRHPMAVWISENAYGEVDTVLEDVSMPMVAIKKRFGMSALPKRIKDNVNGDPYTWATLRHLTRPFDPDLYQYSRRGFDTRMAYMSIWYDPEDEVIVDVGGYWEFPYAVWRYDKNPNEEYGRSPTHKCLGDILVANQMTRARMKLGNYIADPAVIVDEGLEGQDTLLPGDRIYRDKKDDTIQDIQRGANFPITFENEQYQNKLIDEHYNIPLYEMLAQMERQMTAREVVERTGEKAANLGPTTGRFERDALQVGIRRTFNIMARGGQLPAPPEAVRRAGRDAILKIEYQGMLAQLQQRYYQTTGINASMAFAGGVMQLFPTSGDWVDPDNLMVEGLEATGCPASIIREKKDVEQLRIKRMEAQAAAAQQEQSAQQEQAMMDNADKLGKKPEKGSPLQGMAEAAAARAGA